MKPNCRRCDNKMQALFRRQTRFLPYMLTISVILFVYQHFSGSVTDIREQSYPSKMSKLKATTTKQVKEQIIETYNYSILENWASKIHDICSNTDVKELMGRFPSQHAKHLIVDDKTKVLFCYLPKVACTNFKRVFLGLAGVVQPSDVDTLSGYDVHFTHLNKLKLLKDYSKSRMLRKLTEYRKFMFVRDPLERLVSAYRSKFVIHPNPDSRAVFLQKIQEFYIEHQAREKERNILKQLQSGVVSFKEFLYYLLDHLELEGQVNEHFVPMATLCNPCEVKYNYIGSYETLNDDANFIFRKIGIPHQFPGKNDNYSSEETRNLVESYYKDLSPDLMRSVWEMFKKDYVIFDMPIPTWFIKYTT